MRNRKLSENVLEIDIKIKFSRLILFSEAKKLKLEKLFSKFGKNWKRYQLKVLSVAQLRLRGSFFKRGDFFVKALVIVSVGRLRHEQNKKIIFSKKNYIFKL